MLLSGCERRPPATSSETPAQDPIVNAPTIQEDSDSISGMVLISGGSFMMGDKDEIDAPLHEVVLRVARRSGTHAGHPLRADVADQPHPRGDRRGSRVGSGPWHAEGPLPQH